MQMMKIWLTKRTHTLNKQFRLKIFFLNAKTKKKKTLYVMRRLTIVYFSSPISQWYVAYIETVTEDNSVSRYLRKI